MQCWGMTLNVHYALNVAQNILQQLDFDGLL